MSTREPVAIVGAGLSGLCLARSFKRAGINSFMLDKGRFPGGRMATILRQGVPIEYGPGWLHSFDIDSDVVLREALQAAQAEEIPTAELPDEVRRRLPVDDPVRTWFLPGGCRSFAANLASSLEVAQCHQVRRIEPMPSGWKISGTVTSDGDSPFSRKAGSLVLTQPWPQVVELLEYSGLAGVMPSDFTADDFRYERCHVLVLEILDLQASVGLSDLNDSEGPAPIRSIRWRKQDRPVQGPVVSIFSDPAWSESHWDDSDEMVRSQLLEAFDSSHGHGISFEVVRQHRWKFARLAESSEGRPSPVILSADPLLIVAGEAFGVSPETPAGLLSARRSAAFAAAILAGGASGPARPQ